MKCFKCGIKLVNIPKVGYIHPESEDCDIKDGIEIHEVDPEIRQYFLNKINEQDKDLIIYLFKKIKKIFI